ncbi:hypothetical protein EYS14_14580 [Alteromonadaceae bacterium M269]|nr:hypothetical protein EYS14_14580 [Alteromonadaceae bacterium M269]
MMKKRLFTVVYLFPLFFILSVSAQTPAISTDKPVEIRERANGNVVTSIPPHTVLTLMQVADGWAQVRWSVSGDNQQEQVGWLEAELIEITGSSSLSSSIKRNFIAKSQDCAWHRPGRGKVCVDTRDAILDCRKAATAEFWQRCEVKVSYDIFSELREAMDVEVGVECDIEIEYKLEDSFNWKKQENNQQDTHQVMANNRSEITLTSLFQFSEYEQVTNVKIENLDCEISTR